MQADILAFIIFDMNFYLRWRRVFVRLHVRPYDVVGFARRNTLSKFTPLVGIQLPFGLFLVGAPDLDFHAVKTALIGAIDGAIDQRIRLFFSTGMRAGLSRHRLRTICRHKSSEK